MDYCTCTILQGGDYRLQVVLPPRRAVSYAEVLVLRAIHGGPETVKDLRITEQRHVDPRVLRDALAEKYGAQVVNQMYPGVIPVVPESALEDRYLVDAGPAAPQNEPTRRRRRRSKQAVAEAPADMYDEQQSESEDQSPV